MSTPPLSIRFTITADDVVNTTRFARRSIRAAALVVAAIAGTVGIFLLVATSALILGLGYMGVALVAGALVGWRPLERLLARRRARTVIGNECTITLTEEALTSNQTGMSAAIEWSALTEIREDRTTLAAYSGDIARMFIPKRAFPTHEALEAFRAEMINRIGRRPAAP